MLIIQPARDRILSPRDIYIKKILLILFATHFKPSYLSATVLEIINTPLKQPYKSKGISSVSLGQKQHLVKINRDDCLNTYALKNKATIFSSHLL